jgi:hypothetical protein
MKTPEECRRRAEFLESLAEAEAEAFRRKAYRQMAEFWRASAKVRAESHRR